MNIKSDIVFNKNEANEIKILKLGSDNQIYNIDKMVAFVFEQIAEKKNYDEIHKNLNNLNKSKSTDETKKFLDSVISDFKKLGFIE